jgi:hypothetical protein
MYGHFFRSFSLSDPPFIPDCRDYPRPEVPHELEIILHYIGFIEFMVAIQPSFNLYTDVALDGQQELHLQYMQLVETRRRCRNLLRLLGNRYALYERTDDSEGHQTSPKSVIQWAKEMMAGTGTELKYNIKLAQRQKRKLFNSGMQRSVMLSNLDRVMETWSLKMGQHTGWWGAVDWKASNFLVKYCAYSYSDGSDVPSQGWIKGDDVFKGAFAVARAIKGSDDGDDRDSDDDDDDDDDENDDDEKKEDDEAEEDERQEEEDDYGLEWELGGLDRSGFDGPEFESEEETG